MTRSCQAPHDELPIRLNGRIKPAWIPLNFSQNNGLRELAFAIVINTREVDLARSHNGALNLLALLLARAFLLLQREREFLVNFVGGPGAQGAAQDLAKCHKREQSALCQHRFERLGRADVVKQGCQAGHKVSAGDGGVFRRLELGEFVTLVERGEQKLFTLGILTLIEAIEDFRIARNLFFITFEEQVEDALAFPEQAIQHLPVPNSTQGPGENVERLALD